MINKAILAKVLAEKAKQGLIQPRGYTPRMTNGMKPVVSQPPMGNMPMNAPQASTDPLLNLQNNLSSPPQINLAPKKGLKQPKFPNLMKSFKPSPNM